MNHVQVEHRLSFTVVVAPASGNWKHPLPLKIRFLFKTLCLFPVVTNVLEMAELVPLIVYKHEEFKLGISHPAVVLFDVSMVKVPPDRCKKSEQAAGIILGSWPTEILSFTIATAKGSIKFPSSLTHV